MTLFDFNAALDAVNQRADGHILVKVKDGYGLANRAVERVYIEDITNAKGETHREVIIEV